jgi:hypothetical protein
MSDPFDEHLEQELEWITSRASADEPSSHALHEDDTALRESWLAFGKLLETASDNFDEAELVAKVRSTAAVGIPPSQRSKQLARWIGMGAIATSLLAAAITWRLGGGDRERLTRDSAAPAEQTEFESSPLREEISNEQYAWDDSLDERIAEAGYQLMSVQSDWRGYDAPYAAIDQRMQDLTEALEDEPL